MILTGSVGTEASAGAIATIPQRRNSDGTAFGALPCHSPVSVLGMTQPRLFTLPPRSGRRFAGTEERPKTAASGQAAQHQKQIFIGFGWTRIERLADLFHLYLHDATC